MGKGGEDECDKGPTMAERFDALKGKLHCIFKPYYDDPCGTLSFLMTSKLCLWVLLIALADIVMHGMAAYCAIEEFIACEDTDDGHGIPQNLHEAEGDMMIYNIVRTVVLDVAGLLCSLMLLKAVTCKDASYIYPWLFWKLIVVIGGSIVFLVSVVIKTGAQTGMASFLMYEGFFVLVNLVFFLVTYGYALQLDKDAKCDDPCMGGSGGDLGEDAVGDEFVAPPPSGSDTGYAPQGYVKMMISNWRGGDNK